MQQDYTADYLIVGQGLAGTALAWELLWAGATVLVVDRAEAVTSSKIAAGLLTPITGMRWSLSDDYPSHWAAALQYYRRVQRDLGASFLHRCPHVRLFHRDDAAQRWREKKQSPEMKRFVNPEAPVLDDSVFTNPRGGIEMRHSGYLDTSTYLEASRQAFVGRGCWLQGEVGDISVEPRQVKWQGKCFRSVIFCTGWEAARHRWFDWVPFKPARGTITQVEADLRGESRIINHGCWMLPQPSGGLKAGSTYDTTFSSAHEVPEADLATLSAKLSTALRVPFRIVGSRSAVRPIIDRQRVIIGRHPAHDTVAFFNGLGSKGALRSPFFAKQLAAHLMHGAPVPHTADLRGNL